MGKGENRADIFIPTKSRVGRVKMSIILHTSLLRKNMSCIVTTICGILRDFMPKSSILGVLWGAVMFRRGAKIDRRAPKSRPVRHSGLPEPPLVVLNVACWSVGLLGSIFHYFLDLGSILWMFLGCVLVHLGFRHAAILT